MALHIFLQKLILIHFVTDYELNLFGSTIDNLVVVGDNEFLLDTDIIHDSVLIQTFGSSSLVLNMIFMI